MVGSGTRKHATLSDGESDQAKSEAHSGGVAKKTGCGARTRTLNSRARTWRVADYSTPQRRPTCGLWSPSWRPASIARRGTLPSAAFANMRSCQAREDSMTGLRSARSTRRVTRQANASASLVFPTVRGRAPFDVGPSSHDPAVAWLRGPARGRRWPSCSNRGYTQAEVARRLGVSRPTVCFHARRLGLRPTASAKRYDWANVQAFYDLGFSAAESPGEVRVYAVHLGGCGPPRRDYGSPAARASGGRAGRWATEVEAARQVSADVGRTKTTVLRELRAGGMAGTSDFARAPPPYGDGDDNRLENLQLLCPNCHSQTDTWGGRNKGRQRVSN